MSLVGLVILDLDGGRVASKYDPLSDKQKKLLGDHNKQRAFEASLVQKTERFTSKTDVDVVMVEDMVVLFRWCGDVCLYLVGTDTENELILADVFSGFHSALSTIAGGQIGKRQLFDNLEQTFLVIDEISENGVIMEMDPSVIVNRVNMIDAGEERTPFKDALTSAHNNILRSFLS